MQRELDALLRAIGGDSQRRARMQSLMQEIVFALQVHNAKTVEADRDLVARLRMAIDQDQPHQPAPYPQQQYRNGGTWHGSA